LGAPEEPSRRKAQPRSPRALKGALHPLDRLQAGPHHPQPAALQIGVEASGVTSTLAASFFRYGIPLPILVMGLGAVAAYLVGMHMAAAGLLAPFFATLFPPCPPGPVHFPAFGFHHVRLLALSPPPLSGLDPTSTSAQAMARPWGNWPCLCWHRFDGLGSAALPCIAVPRRLQGESSAPASAGRLLAFSFSPGRRGARGSRSGSGKRPPLG